ncbi:glutathione S-transferase N-terminal domain-containing protein [Roseateles cellulosilyticus]|uniref:Glutathione S-transferase N-terminal domain-containing protein n=1 Tax=Pelomonas cellulosilytica TaxID=2906762 RepID=A0ABS8XQC8_9BURK|nr:glutathione S-transferase N-terminal domain-containing protein [Pelomonas sp. P8]MCE4554033.1 glutathione S-transferase N-terminal domain-containing protein [Pelomonas sp. P8]
MKLYIGNKNYSSWSMRSGVLLAAFGIPFEEVMLRFDFSPGSDWHRIIPGVSPTKRVPVLVEDDGFAVWDTLAIAEYVADRHPEHAIWPRAPKARARARSLCAEMHAGFTRLRTVCPMNIEAFFPDIGAKLWAEDEALRADVARLAAAWSDALAASGGPFLFGAFGAVDAYFAPVAVRLSRFGLPVPEAAAAYRDALLAHPAVEDWVAEALREQHFVPEDEPYRTTR